MTERDTTKVFTSGEVARVCGVSADTVSRWFDMGQIEGYRLGPGGDRRIPYESLRKFMVAHGIPLDRLDTESRCILVVDDDPHYLDIIPPALGQLNSFQVLTASTGFDAGALVADWNPRLVILDINLTDMDGRTVCRRVKQRPETRTTRVLAISGYIEDDEVAQLKEAGFDAYLKKPFSIEALLEKVQQLLKLPDAKVVRPTETTPR